MLRSVRPEHLRIVENLGSSKIFSPDDRCPFLWGKLNHQPHFQARRFVMPKRDNSSLPHMKSRNGSKIVRMAPILTIFAPNESQRCQLNFAKFSRCRKSFREDENFKKLSRKVRKSLSRVRFRATNNIETAI